MRYSMQMVIMISLLLLVFTSITNAAPVPPIIYVAGDGSGDFNCDGKNDQEEINAALSYIVNNPEYTTVYLKGPFTYHITDTVFIGSNTILEGDRKAVMKLGSNLQWPDGKAMIEPKRKTGERNITIRGFEMDGNHDGNLHRSRGKTYHNLMTLRNTKNITVNDMYMHDAHSDGLKVEHDSYTGSPTNIKFYNNRVERLGHDALYCIRTSNIEAWNNFFITRTNSAVRLSFSSNAKIHDNEITATYNSGGPGIEIQNKGPSYISQNIEIYNNLIYETYGPGIWIFTYGSMYLKSASSGIHIHHNIFLNTGTNKTIDWVGGIILNGFDKTIIENNVFDGCYGQAIAARHARPEFAAPGTGYTTIIRNNIIMNTKFHSMAGNGIAIRSLLSGYIFKVDYNCLYNNPGGNYKNIEPGEGNIEADPLFADTKTRDYHLRSIGGRWNDVTQTWLIDTIQSPCIDAGHPESDYSNEPADNGGRINIGLYGNTQYASKAVLVK